MEMMTQPQQEAIRQDRLNEVGTEPMCPFCGNPRVRRNDYIRCNPCGTNWLDEEMHLPNYLHSDPRIARRVLALTDTKAKPIAAQQDVDVEDFTVPKL
jgi:hypothetical protein